jgi:single-strand DNA-binding protein
VSKSVNKVILIGHVGKAPEIRYTQGGAPVANFSLATNESWTAATGEKQERTEWHRIVAWRKLAEICQEYVQKGSLLYVEGKLQTRSWEDRDGSKRYTTEIIMNNMAMLDRKQAGGGMPSVDSGDVSIDSLPPEPGSAGDDDVPF